MAQKQVIFAHLKVIARPDDEDFAEVAESFRDWLQGHGFRIVLEGDTTWAGEDGPARRIELEGTYVETELVPFGPASVGGYLQ